MNSETRPGHRTSRAPDLSYAAFLAAEAHVEARRRRPLRLLLLFLATFLALQYGWEMSRGTALERFVIHDLTVKPAAWIIDGIWPQTGVQAQAHRLVAPAGRLNILNGCEGLETLFLLMAAFVAYPFAWRVRLLGMVLGVGVVFALNQMRIVMLWQVWSGDRTLFGLLHGTLLPLALIA
ncbi:MAG: archaeosortase/exosortase family protein, partial [Sulfuricellaceae bacterium]|nr:archaeosortase/exosortase family protein [Sulfuricellaceae bacterium]